MSLDDIKSMWPTANNRRRLVADVTNASAGGYSANMVTVQVIWTARCLERKCLWFAESQNNAEILQLIKRHEHPSSCEVHQRRIFRSKNQNS
jgi:hypothetical protein